MPREELEAWVEQAAEETALTPPQAEAFYRFRVVGPVAEGRGRSDGRVR